MLLRYESPRESSANKLKLIHPLRFARETRLKWRENRDITNRDSWWTYILIKICVLPDFRTTFQHHPLPSVQIRRITSQTRLASFPLLLISERGGWRVIDNSNLHWQHTIFFFPLETKVISKLCSVLYKKSFRQKLGFERDKLYNCNYIWI